MPPLRTAFLAQTFGGLIASGLIALLHRDAFAHPFVVAVVQGCCAAFVSHKLEAPPWWLPIHLVFMPLAIALHGLDLPTNFYLIVFISLLLIFWRTDRSQVPLYFSNVETVGAIATLLPETDFRFVDLGCGNGHLLNRLARMRPDGQFLGVEHAPLPFLWAKLRNLGQENCQIRFGDYWCQNLDGFEVAYAFLSPAPMPRLWMKAHSEMTPGTLLISNSFPIPGIPAEQVISVPDRRMTRLYCYHPPTDKAANPAYSQAIESARPRQ